MLVFILWRPPHSIRPFPAVALTHTQIHTYTGQAINTEFRFSGKPYICERRNLQAHQDNSTGTSHYMEVRLETHIVHHMWRIKYICICVWCIKTKTGAFGYSENYFGSFFSFCEAISYAERFFGCVAVYLIIIAKRTGDFDYAIFGLWFKIKPDPNGSPYPSQNIFFLYINVISSTRLTTAFFYPAIH